VNTVIDPQKDYYAVLGITSEADDSEIKHAYRERARRYHPDSAHGDAARFRLIQEAYEVLADFAMRRAYDRQRESRGLSEDASVSFELYQSRRSMRPLDGPQLLYVLAEMRSREELARTPQRLNLALVIDRSTSMRGVRMQNVKVAAADLLEALHAEDRLALVTFSDRAEVVAPSDFVDNTRSFKSALTSMSAGGGTEIYQGLLAGLKQVRRYASEDRINHVILLTDGRTYGDEAQALREARRCARQGIGISAFGIGEDWNDVFLDDLARAGNGVSRYISSASEVQEVLKEQIRGLSNIAVKRMRLSINAASYVEVRNAYRSEPYMEILQEEDGTFALGNLTADEPAVVVLELLVQCAETGDRRIARLYLEAEEASTSQSLRLRQDVEATFTLEPREEVLPPRLLNAMTRLSVFQLQENAWQALEQGDAQQATRFLESAATRLFDMGHRELAQAAMLEVGRLSQGVDPTGEGRKKLRYGTRSLTTSSR
jgi:Ca-activated chloride channel family protein